MTGNVFPRQNAAIPIATGGEGCYLFDSAGKRYFDGSGGAAVSCLGHGDLEIIDAIKSQLDKLAFAHTGFFTSEPAEKLAAKLIEHAPKPLDRVYFVSGGSEAMEAAIKLARQYFLEIGKPQKSKIISRKQSYHGNTLGALAVGGNAWRRAPFDPLLIDVSHISPCFEYRGKPETESSFDYGQRVANELETEIHNLGAANVMAFVAEPVVGATLGAVPAVEGYFKRIREICDTHDVLLILDEVMCGMGRTGSLFACTQDDVAPDILAIAKGLGAGYQPIGATLCSKEIYAAVENGSGFFQHGHTYIGHPVATAAGLAVLNALIDRDLIPQVQTLGTALKSALEDRFGQHHHIGDIRGRGLFIGLELVEDRDTKTPFAAERKINKRLKQAAFDEGLICYPMGGTVDGVNGDHVLLAPPFIMSHAQIDEVVTKLDRAINKVLA